MTERLLFSILVLATMACCGGGREEAPARGGHDRDEPASAEAHHDASKELRLSADVLRDVRMTVVPVERRTAAASSSALVGELRVDERRYGEVVTPVQGRLSRVLVDVGQRVIAGQALAELQSADLGRAGAAYFSAASRLELAEATLTRKRTLAAEKIAPLREVQEAQAEADAAHAELRAARAGLSALGVSHRDLDADDRDADDRDAARLTLRAPVSGVVIDRNAVVGRAAQEDEPLFRVGDLSTLWLVVHAFERDALRVALNTEATISFAALPGETFGGRVVLVGRQVNVESRAVPVRIEVRNPGGRLKPGMSGTAVLPLGEATETVLVVPAAAIQRLGDDWVVFVRHEDDPGHFEIRPIGRGRELGTAIEIVRGLDPGDRVVVQGAFVLKAEAEKARGQSGDPHGH